jgi:septal ring factor EnvC (AmiA/AmiB activator)
MQIKKVHQLIAQLALDKENNKKRREELIRIRLEQNKDISDNFSKMKGKLQWPVIGKISGKYGLQKNEELNTFTENPGVEIMCANDSKIVSVMDGIVMHVGYIGGYGNVIIIDHGDEYSTVYGNISEIFVYEDDYVSPGKVIGKIYSINRIKSYLHFEVWHNGKTQNPELWLNKK